MNYRKSYFGFGANSCVGTPKPKPKPKKVWIAIPVCVCPIKRTDPSMN